MLAIDLESEEIDVEFAGLFYRKHAEGGDHALHLKCHVSPFSALYVTPKPSVRSFVALEHASRYRPDEGRSMVKSERRQADFGYRQVPLEDKQGLVNDVFHSVARRYDLMNDLMSFGLHRAWKNALVTAVDPPKDLPFALLDIAGGTGDVALRVIEAGGEGTRAVVCDINADMLAVGRERAARRPHGEFLTFTEANAESLPFVDRSFDAASVAFGIRNVPRIELALAEAYRVLRPGG